MTEKRFHPMLNEMVLEKPAIRRRNRRKWLIAGFGVVLMSIFTCVAKTEPATTYEQSPQFREGCFHNVVPRSERSFAEGVRIWWDFLLNKPAGTPQAISSRPTPRGATKCFTLSCKDRIVE